MFRQQSSAAVYLFAGVCVTLAGVWASAEGIGGVEHLLVDCVDLQRRELWQYVAAWGAATHLLDPFTQRLHPKVRLLAPALTGTKSRLTRS